MIVLPVSEIPGGPAYQRPSLLHGVTTKHRTGCGSLYLIVNEEDGQVREVLCKLGKAGGCAAALLEVVGRLVSVALQHGVPLAPLAKQCAGIRSHQHQGEIIQCCVSHIGNRLNEVSAESETASDA